MTEQTIHTTDDEAVRELLSTSGPHDVFGAIARTCAQIAPSAGADSELWELAAEAAHEALAVLAGEEDEEEGGNEDEDDADQDATGNERAPLSNAGEDAAGAELPGAHEEDEAEAAPADETTLADASSAPAPAKRTRMPKEDQLGPRPPTATHWRCRRVEDGGKKSTLMFHDDGSGIAVCEWPIKSCSAEAIRERWGDTAGAFVVQFIATDGTGQRRPCGRSRVLHLIAPQAEEAPAALGALAPVARALPLAASPAAIPGGDSFQQMLSLLAFLHQRDEQARAAAREDAKLAIERQRIESDVRMEQERLASKERIVQLELSAKAAGRAPAAPALDAEALAERIGEAVGAKLEEVYDQEGDDAPAAASADGALLSSLAPLLVPLLQPLLANLQPAPTAAAGSALAAAPDVAATQAGHGGP